MNNIREDFIKLISDKSKTAEDIFNIMYKNHADNFSTKGILRSLTSWRDCIYQGTIGENDFVIAEPSSTSLDNDNIEMVYDDYKKTMITFIEMFREEYEKDPNKHPIGIMLNIYKRYLSEVFAGASRNDEKAKTQRNVSGLFDEKNQQKKYNISAQKGEGRAAICCERNVTIGNAFQFMGFDTYHVIGSLYFDDDSVEGHAFTLIKYGQTNVKYVLFDLYNGIVIKNILSVDYDFTNGFAVKFYSEKHKKNLIYKLDGPLYQMTNEILEIEIIIRNLANRLQLSEYKYKRNLDIEENLDIKKLKEEFLNLLSTIENSAINDIFKKRYIDRIQTYYMMVIEKIESNYTNSSSVHHS